MLNIGNCSNENAGNAVLDRSAPVLVHVALRLMPQY